jgi:hypothetical protein
VRRFCLPISQEFGKSIEWFLTGNVKLARGKAVGGRIYRVKITLKGIRAPIWHRVQVPGITWLLIFHDVIQTVFGWRDVTSTSF